MSKKNFDFYGLDNSKVDKCNVICNIDHTALGIEYVTYQISRGTEYEIEYKNDKRFGLLSSENNTPKDLLCALMELNHDTSNEAISEFFKTYGFFFYNDADYNRLYPYYKDSDIRKLIHHLRELISFNNIYIKYINHSERLNAGYNDVYYIDYTELCNRMLKFYYSDIIKLTASIKKDGLSDRAYDAISQFDLNVNDIYHLGNDYVHNYLSVCETNNIDISVIPDLSKRHVPRLINNKLLEDDAENTFMIYHIVQMEMWCNLPYKGLFNDLSEAERHFSGFCIELFHNKLFNFERKNTQRKWDSPLKIPTVKNLNGNDEKSKALQKKLMNILSLIINDQINQIIKNIKPYIADVTENDLNTSNIFLKNENLLCLIMMEIAELKKKRIECRACCKPDCPEKGKYYFLANVNDLQSTCYDKKCRIRINKKNFDAKHK